MPRKARTDEVSPNNSKGESSSGAEQIHGSTEPDPHILKLDDQFAVVDAWGDMLPNDPAGKGLYWRDTRHLSLWELRLFGARPSLMSSSNADPVTQACDLTNANYGDGTMSAPQNALHLNRTKFLIGSECLERVRIRNFSLESVHVELSVAFDADFRDIFEVRGHPRSRRGEVAASAGADLLRFEYTALDGLKALSTVMFDPAPKRLDRGIASYAFDLEPQEVRDLVFAISCEGKAEKRSASDFEDLLASVRRDHERRLESYVRISSSNRQFESMLRQACGDLVRLVSRTPHGEYPYAGVPWYSTVFGRDGIITALLSGWLNPELSRGVLRLLAASQADEVDPETDAQPGKIVHEIRLGELARLREVPFARYYGTIDATPLFISLAARYVAQTNDIETLREIWPNLKRADLWIDNYGDCDGDGFVEYKAQTPTGLTNQGWKDSGDSMFHAGGDLAEGPIALCEVQAFVHLAKNDLAGLALIMDDPSLAERLRNQAASLRRRFDTAFWLSDLSTYAMALDGAKRPCRVKSSNAGYALLGGLALEERAEPLARSLLAPESFSGWGVRTLANNELRYNPMAYHNGSVWPHDNAMIALGLARYGFKDAVVSILSGLFEASQFMDLYRLPELFCGFARSPSQGPIHYPVACSPQAWASASILGLVRSALGLRFDAQNRTLFLDRPALPSFVEEIRFSGVKLGGHELDLIVQQQHGAVSAVVPRRTGDLDVVVLH